MDGLILKGTRPGSRSVGRVGIVVGVLLICGGVVDMVLTIITAKDPPGLAPYLTIGGIAVLFVTSVKSKTSSPGQVELMPGGELRLSWSPKAVSVGATGIGFGGWYDRANHVPVGIFAEIGGVRIGGRDLDESGYRLYLKPEWWVDIEFDQPTFTRLLHALGVAKPAGPGLGFVAHLVPNSRGPAGLFHGLPGWKSLHVVPDELVVTGGKNGSVAARAGWHAVGARCLGRRVEVGGFDSGVYDQMPILELTVGGHRPVLLGRAHTVRSPVNWPSNSPVAPRYPDYVLGETHWRMLLEVLAAKRLVPVGTS